MFDFSFNFDFNFDSVFEIIYTLVCAVYTYVGTSLGGQRMAEKVGMEKPWLFWIPGANLYALGRLADIQASRCEGKTTCFRKKILIWLIVPTAIIVPMSILVGIWDMIAIGNGLSDLQYDLGTSPALDVLAGLLTLCIIALLVAYIIFLVVYYKALHRAYRLFAPDSATGLLVLSIFVSASVPAILFALSFKEPVLPAEQNDDWDAPFYTL